MVLVGLLFVWGERRYAGSVGGFDNGIEVEHNRVACLVAEVGEVEGDLRSVPRHAGDEFANLHIELDGVDEDNIVGAGVAGTRTGVEAQLYAETVSRQFPLFASVTRQELHPSDKAGGEQQTGIVDMDGAILIDETLLVEAGELVVLDVAILVGFLGEAALDDGTEERGGVLHSFEKGTLPQLRLGLLVVNLCRTATAKGFAEAGVIDTIVDSAGFLDDGWFDFGHNF